MTLQSELARDVSIIPTSVSAASPAPPTAIATDVYRGWHALQLAVNVDLERALDEAEQIRQQTLALLATLG